MMTPDMTPQGAAVLVIDEDPLILELVSSTLQSAGYRVTTAHDAWQEEAQALGLKFDLIISNIVMTGGHAGSDVVKRLRSLSTALPRPPIIFMTGLELDVALKFIPWDPRIRLVCKPISFEALRAAIRDLIGVDWPL